MNPVSPELVTITDAGDDDKLKTSGAIAAELEFENCRAGIDGGVPNGFVAAAMAGDELRLVDVLKGFEAP